MAVNSRLTTDRGTQFDSFVFFTGEKQWNSKLQQPGSIITVC